MVYFLDRLDPSILAPAIIEALNTVQFASALKPSKFAPVFTVHKVIMKYVKPMIINNIDDMKVIINISRVCVIIPIFTPFNFPIIIYIICYFPKKRK